MARILIIDGSEIGKFLDSKLGFGFASGDDGQEGLEHDVDRIIDHSRVGDFFGDEGERSYDLAIVDPAHSGTVHTLPFAFNILRSGNPASRKPLVVYSRLTEAELGASPYLLKPGIHYTAYVQKPANFLGSFNFHGSEILDVITRALPAERVPKTA